MVAHCDVAIIRTNQETKSRRHDFDRDSELDRSWIRGALVSERDAGGGSAELVRGTVSDGGNQLDFLCGAGSANGGTLVQEHAGGFCVRCKAASIALASFDGAEVVAASCAKAGGDRCEG